MEKVKAEKNKARDSRAEKGQDKQKPEIKEQEQVQPQLPSIKVLKLEAALAAKNKILEETKASDTMLEHNKKVILDQTASPALPPDQLLAKSDSGFSEKGVEPEHPGDKIEYIDDYDEEEEDEDDLEEKEELSLKKANELFAKKFGAVDRGAFLESDDDEDDFDEDSVLGNNSNNQSPDSSLISRVFPPCLRVSVSFIKII